MSEPIALSNGQAKVLCFLSGLALTRLVTGALMLPVSVVFAIFGADPVTFAVQGLAANAWVQFVALLVSTISLGMFLRQGVWIKWAVIGYLTSVLPTFFLMAATNLLNPVSGASAAVESWLALLYWTAAKLVALAGFAFIPGFNAYRARQAA